MNRIAQKISTPKLVITQRRETMTTMTRSENRQSRAMFLALTVGLAGLFGSSDVSLALQNDPIYNKCLCVCKGGGGFLTDIRNTAGVACSAYDGKTCSVENADGTMTTSETTGCVGDKAGGTRATIGPSSLAPNAPVLQQTPKTPTTPGGMRAPTTGTIQRRGIEGEQPAEPTPPSPTVPEEKGK
jgi:hypothetical protein